MTTSLCKLAVLVAFIVVTLGALTRLLDAGLGCPDWPGCYGQLIPPETTNYSAITVIDQSKAWMEMVHRYLAASLGVLIVVIALKIQTNNRSTLTIKWLSRSLVVLVVMQGLLGMLTVTLKLLPQIVTLHLLGGMATLALLFLLTLKLHTVKSVQPAPAPAPAPARLLAVLLLLVLSCQIALGGWTSSNYAGLACPDFPTCQQQWLPEMNLSQAFNLTKVDNQNYEGGVLSLQLMVTIQVVHRIVALLVVVTMMTLCIRLWSFSQAKIALVTLVVLSLIQVILGIANAVLLLPLPLALAHNTGAALLLLNVVYINHLLFEYTQHTTILSNSTALADRGI